MFDARIVAYAFTVIKRIGFGTAILPNVTIGRNCIIGAGSVVTRDIPDDSIASGAPARVTGSRSPMTRLPNEGTVK